MLLAINANNTNIAFAVWDGDRLEGAVARRHRSQAHRRRICRLARSLLALEGSSRATIDGAIIASVVPEANFNLRRLCRDYFRQRAAGRRRSRLSSSASRC